MGGSSKNPFPDLLPLPAISSPLSSSSSYFGSGSFGWLLEVEDDQDLDLQAPLLEELDIDLKDIAYKIRCVLLPFKVDRETHLENPDFWGPLVVVLLYALLLIWGQFKVVSWVLTMWFVGSLVIFLLGRVLGAGITYSMSLGVIGYSLLPLAITVAILPFVSFLVPLAWALRIVGTCWAAYSAGSLLITPEIAHKRILLAYPILLLYIYFMSLQSGV